MAVDASGNINVAWEDHAGNRDTFFTRSTDSGTSFPTIVNLSDDSGLSIAAQMAADKNGNLNVVWQDDTPGLTSRVSQIFFSRLPAEAGANQPPTIVTPPADQTVTVGQMAKFSVTASGTATLSYQWQKNGADISGAALDSYTTPATTTQDNGAQFRVVVSNSVGTATSNVAMLTVNAPPSITSQPASQTVTVGQMAKFSVTASGTATLSYQWQKNGADISGATLDSYTTPATTTQDNGAQFRVVVSNSVGTAASNVATLTVNAPPSITSQPASQTVTVGQMAKFSVTASGTATLSYQWQKNGADISGATLDSYTTPATTTQDNGAQFRVVVSNSVGTAASNVATLTVNAPPSITSQPASQTVTVGQMAKFSVTASGTATLSYQWQKNGADISGATLDSYTTPATTTQDNGAQFRVVVSNSVGTAASNVATLTVNAPPSITSQPASQTVTVGQMAKFSVTASGTATLSYQWQKNGADISGATLDSYTTPATTTQDNGAQFRVVVSNSVGTAASNVATLTVNAPPSITSQPASQTVTVGQMAKFSVTASGTATLSYQWQKNGADISGATLDSYTTPATTTQDNGAQFRVVVSNSVGTATSNVATLTVNTPPQCSPTLRVSLSPDALWPPNHKLVQITATVETSDSCDANPAVALVSITSSEPDDGLGDGDEPNDIQPVNGGSIAFGADVQPFLLRAERSGMGTGRIYIVTYMVRDAAGNKSLASAQVSVGSQTIAASPKRSSRKK